MPAKNKNVNVHNKNRDVNHESMLQKKKRFIVNNAKRVKNGEKARPLPDVFKKLPFVQIQPLKNVQVQNRRKNNKRTRTTTEKKQKVVMNVAAVTNTPVPWDQNSLYVMIEALTAHYAMNTDLFTVITPQEFAYYLGYQLLIWINTNGVLAGSNFPAGADQAQTSIPFAFAKYLEYLAPYKGQTGLSISTRWTYAANLLFTSAAPANGTVGVTSTMYTRPVGMYPNWSFGDMRNTIVSNPIPGFIPPQLMEFRMATAPSVAFGTLISNDEKIVTISSALNKRGNTVRMCDIPTIAPDSSAYARSLTPLFGVADVGVGGIQGVDSNFDPEIATIFAPGESTGSIYGNNTRKSYVPPLFTVPNATFPDYFQIASMWVYLAQTYQGSYKQGKFRSAFPFCGVELVSLYPLEQPVTGIGLSQCVQAVHNQYIANKSKTTLDAPTTAPGIYDLTNKYITVEATVAFSAFQKRMNMCEVFHIQCPATFSGPFGAAGATIPVISPQFFYVDQAFDVEQDLLVTSAISRLGPVVVHGRLKIPFNLYEGPVAADANMVGPAAWSAYGLKEPDYQNTTNLLTTCWGYRAGSAPIPANAPNIIWDDSGATPLACDANFVSNWVGAQNTITNTPNTLYSAYPTSGAAGTIIDTFNRWRYGDTTSQAPPVAPVTHNLHGDFETMTAIRTTDEDSLSIRLANRTPDNLTDPPGVLNALFNTPDSLALAGPAEKDVVAIAALDEFGNPDNSVEATPLRRERYMTVKRLVFAGSVVPAYTPFNSVGEYGVDIPWGTGKAGLLSALAQSLSATASPTSNLISQAKGRSDYDPVKLFRQLAGSAMESSMRGNNASPMALSRYLAMDDYSTGGKKKGKGLLGKAVGAVKIVGKAYRTGKEVVNAVAAFV